MQKARNILAAFRLQYSTHRKCLQGIAKYIKRNRNWRVTLIDNFEDLSAEIVKDVVRKRYDGLITVNPHSEAARNALETIPLPIAVLGTSEGELSGRKKNAVFIRARHESIGRAAAQYILSLGKFASHGFLQAENSPRWSDNRFSGFRAELRHHGLQVFEIRSPWPSGTAEDIEFIRAALQKQPKPIALLAAYDNRAMDILSACRQEALDVPGKVSVVGVDNDEMLCDLSTPSLTSFDILQQAKGELAAMELEKLIAKRRDERTKVVFHNKIRIVERETTRIIAPATHLIERALSYISAHACSGLRPIDVVNHLGVSYALATRRFREMTGTTILGEINRIRIAKVKQLLAESEMPIGKISSSCGFPEPNYAKRLFKRYSGCSMSQWRQTNGLPGRMDLV